VSTPARKRPAVLKVTARGEIQRRIARALIAIATGIWPSATQPDQWIKAEIAAALSRHADRSKRR